MNISSAMVDRAVAASASPWWHRVSDAHAFVRWGVALGLFIVALAARQALNGWLPPLGFPFLTFFPAVMLSAYLAGLGPGLFCSGLSIAAAWYWFIPPRTAFLPLAQADAVALVFFSAILLIDCLVIHVMNNALLRGSHSERLLRASEQRLRGVLDRLVTAVALLEVDGTVREVNEAVLARGAMARDAALGRPLWELPWWRTDAALAARVRQSVERAARGESVREDVEVALGPGRRLVIDLQIAPLREPDGRIAALVACGVDVTARQDAADALARSRAEALELANRAEAERRVLDATFNAVPAGIIVADATGRLLRMNRANERIWGIAPYSTDIAGYGEWKGWWAGDSPRAGQRIPPDEWGLARSVRTGEECTELVEIEPFGQPGKRLVTLLSSAPVLDPGGQVVGGVVVQVDITDRIQAERALREADRQKDTFLATLSHELRNPLAPIRSAAQVIRMSPATDERTRQAAAVIERQSGQLVRLVDDLLELSRLNFGNLVLQRRPADLRDVVDSALETTRPQVDAAGHRLVVGLPPQPLPVDVDETRIAQCIANLVGNAVKFTPPPGRIEVQAEAAADGTARVRVRDNGPGIAPDMQDKVFDLFAQDRRAGGPGNGGLGIGLALTRRLVEMHGGQVTVRSAGLGQGAEFEVRLPLAAASPGPEGDRARPAQPAAAEAPAPPASAAAEPTVLVVDDNVDAAETLQLLLEMQGLRVATAADGASALARARALRPAVVVLDIGLPDMTGYDVARQLRADAADAAPLLIALTGWGQARDRERAVEAGFDHHFTKPADPDRLAALVRERLSAMPA